MSDKHTIYPAVKCSDIVFTELKIEPNTITLCNNLLVTPYLLYNLYYDYYIISILLVWLRAYLDGLDGYIARKYDKCSKLGDIYDHFSDCLYAGFLTCILMNKVNYLQPYAYPLGYFNSVMAVVCDYDERFKCISKIAGAGGNEDGYSFLIPVSSVCFFWTLYLFGVI